MSIKPILFNTEMVRAILDGRKTVTRRVVKDIPSGAKCSCVCDDYATFRWQTKAKNANIAFDKEKDVNPPHRPGDILYVRETFKVDYLSNIPGTGRIHYKADDTYSDFSFSPDRYDMMRRAQLKPGWRSNENMPREAARIFLRVTGVRVERLQAIENIAAEGITMIPADNDRDPRFYFIQLWDSTIKPTDRERYGWAANPWVWVISFERCEKPEEV